MSDKTSAGSAGHGAFRVTPEGQVYLDPQDGDGAWPEGVTQTRLRGLALDRGTGALWLGDVARVDVTKSTAPPDYATDGMVQSAFVDQIGQLFSTLTASKEGSLRLTGTREAGDYGWCMEVGASFRGVAIAIYPSGGEDLLIMRSGDGVSLVTTSEAAVTITAAPVGDYVLEMSWSATSGRVACYVNGGRVDLISGLSAEYAVTGSEVGILGGQYGLDIVLPPEVSALPADQYPGTIGGLAIFLNQLTSDVAL